MAERVENEPEVDMFNHISTKTETEFNTHANTTISPLDAFVAKSIHPPSAYANYAGIPTQDTRSQVVANWRSVKMSGPLTGTDGTPGSTPTKTVFSDSSSSRVYIIPNGARVNSIELCSTSDTSISVNSDTYYQNVNNGVDTNSYNFKNWVSDTQLYRTAYKSTTFSLNTTAFNDVGIVTAYQFNPAILFAGTLLTLASEKLEHFKALVQCHLRRGTKLLIGSRDIEYEPKLETFQKFPKYIREELKEMLKYKGDDFALDLDPNTTIQIVNFAGASYLFNAGGVPGQFPTNSILQASAKSTSTLAKEGAFVVQRLNTLSPEWLAVGNTRSTGLPNTPGLYDCYTSSLDSAGAIHVDFFTENLTTPTPTQVPRILRDTLWSKDMTWAIVKFEGLAYNNTVAAGSQIIVRKTYVGLEIQPAPNSAWTGMMEPGPKPDLGAMQALMQANYELKDCMPARFNIWGILAKAASGIAKSPAAQSFLKNAAKALIGSFTEETKPSKKKAAKGNKKKKEDKPLKKEEVDDIVEAVEKVEIDEKKKRKRKPKKQVKVVVKEPKPKKQHKK